MDWRPRTIKLRMCCILPEKVSLAVNGLIKCLQSNSYKKKKTLSVTQWTQLKYTKLKIKLNWLGDGSVSKGVCCHAWCP